MENLRLDLRLVGSGILGSRVVVDGAVGGRVLGAYIDPKTSIVTQTIVPQRIARQRGQEVSTTPAVGSVLIGPDTAIYGDDAPPQGSDAAPQDAPKKLQDAPKKHDKKRIGKLSRLWVDRGSATLTHLLFTMNGMEHVVQAAQVASFSAQHIALTLTSNEALALPVSRDDAAIAGDIGTTLQSILLDPRARRDIHARVEDGHVDISGVVDAEELSSDLLAAIRRVPGVRGVQSDIIVTEDLATLAARAIEAARAKGSLGEDAEVEILSEHQIIHLRGSVATAKASAEAERAALTVPGARLVVNILHVREHETTERADPASPPTKLR